MITDQEIQIEDVPFAHLGYYALEPMPRVDTRVSVPFGQDSAMEAGMETVSSGWIDESGFVIAPSEEVGWELNRGLVPVRVNL